MEYFQPPTCAPSLNKQFSRIRVNPVRLSCDAWRGKRAALQPPSTGAFTAAMRDPHRKGNIDHIGAQRMCCGLGFTYRADSGILSTTLKGKRLIAAGSLSLLSNY
jgi:hypothetical protein